MTFVFTVENTFLLSADAVAECYISMVIILYITDTWRQPYDGTVTGKPM